MSPASYPYHNRQSPNELENRWAPHRVRVNALCPGYQYTPLLKDLLAREGDLSGDWKRDTPMGRLGDPKELRGPIVFMASDASSFMTGMYIEGTLSI